MLACQEKDCGDGEEEEKDSFCACHTDSDCVAWASHNLGCVFYGAVDCKQWLSIEGTDLCSVNLASRTCVAGQKNTHCQKRLMALQGLLNMAL